MRERKVRWIRVKYKGTQGSEPPFWVSERNPYFEWYKRSEFHIITKEEVRIYDEKGKLIRVEKVR